MSTAPLTPRAQRFVSAMTAFHINQLETWLAPLDESAKQYCRERVVEFNSSPTAETLEGFGFSKEEAQDTAMACSVAKAKKDAEALLAAGDVKGAKRALMLAGMLPDDINQFIADHAPKTEQPEVSANETPAPELGASAQAPSVSANGTPQGDLQSRYAEYCAYLTAIFRPGDVLCFVRIDHTKEDGKNTQQIFATLEDALTWESFENTIRDNKGGSIYVAMNTYPASLVGQKKGRTQENVVEVRALQSDMDDAQQAANIVSAMQSSTKVPPPSIVVESSTGKRQGIWLVDGISKDEAKPLMQAIAAEFNTDSAVAEVARVMRLPGFVNRKYATEPVAKLLVNTGVRYTRESFKIDLAAAVAKIERTSPEEYLDAPFIRKGGPYGGIYPQILKIVGHYHETKNIKDGDVMFSIVKGHIEKNGCYLSDGTTPFAWYEKKVRNQCHKLIDEFDKKKDHEQAATTNDALSEAKLVSEQAAALAAAIPADQIVTSPQEWPTVQTTGSAAAAAQGLVFKYPRVHGSDYDYVAAPLLGQKEGWFPLGDPSLVGGSSGSGKTTWVMDVLERQARIADVYGHQTYGRPYLVIMQDRGDAAFRRTMNRMNLDSSKIPIKRMAPITGYAALQALLNMIEEDGQDKVPEIVFVEGGDMLVDDASNPASVLLLMSGLQTIAEHYHVAFILSVGAPKMRVGEGYVAKRDSILGSEKWTRKAEAVVALQYFQGDDTDERRACFVLPRNGPAEKFDLKFSDGKLVLDTDPRPEKPRAREQKPREADRLLEEAKKWYLALFTDSTGQFRKEVPLVDHRKAEQAISIPENTLRRARRGLGIDYSQKTRAYFFLTDPASNTVSMDVKVATTEGAGPGEASELSELSEPASQPKETERPVAA